MAPFEGLSGEASDERKPEISAKPDPMEVIEDEFPIKGAEHLMLCADNFEGGGVDGDSVGTETTEDQEVDVIGCEEGVSGAVLKAEEDAEGTEYSSSFGDTFSGSDEGFRINTNDVEAESPLCIESPQQRAFGGHDRLFKKKKVTAHWRKFISPLMRRCQWLELRMKELRSQALRYDKELTAYKHEKQVQSKMIDLNDSVSRSVPLTCKTFRKPAMKRRKRRKNEDITDISSYMANHNIFSYYENKRCETDGHSVDDDFLNQADEITKGSDDYLWALDFRDGDGILEQVLLNIELLQFRVLNIKAHLSKVLSRNSIDMALGCSFMGDPQVSSAQSPSCSHGNNGLELLVGVPNSPPHPTSEYEMEDMVLPGSAVSSFGDAPDLDIIESTMGLLSGADGPLNSKHLEDFKDNAEDVLINNQAADEELQNFEVSHVIEKPKGKVPTGEPNSDDGSTAPAPIFSESAELAPEGEGASDPQQPVLKPCYTGKRRGRKPKRRRRGGSAAGWKSDRLQKKRRLSG